MSDNPQPITNPPPPATDAARSPWAEAWRRLRRNRLAVCGGVTLLALVLLCFLGPLFSQSFRETNLANTFAPPGAAHWFGTDNLGRDLFGRVLFGGRISFMVGFVASVVALTIGVTYGAVAGWVGGRADALMMRVVDIIYALPFTIFVILLMVFLKDPMQRFDSWLTGFGWFANWQGAGKILLMFAAIGAVEWLTMARIVRGQVMALKRTEFVEAARALGFGPARILFRHVLPNALGPIVVYATLTVPAVMMLEAFLSFLGLGDASRASWGLLLQQAQLYLQQAWWMTVFPGMFLSATILGLNLLGDGIASSLGLRR